ncbi:MAG: DUF1080 domain-containing protein [Pirellulaceae bacterium]|nr:DUF1080 domain-containing protein [Pirellulaceae bacterium]
MPSSSTILVLATLTTVSSPLLATETHEPNFLGAWAFELPDGNPAWLKLSKDGDQLRGWMLWSVGSARPIRSIQIQGESLRFARKITWRPYGESVTKSITRPFQATLKNGKLQLIFFQATADSKSVVKDEQVQIEGSRISPPPPKPDLSDVSYGEVIELFNGQDLTGWKLSNRKKKNGWRVEDGCLINETPKLDFGAYGEFGNLRTEQEFEDFELAIEYNVPTGGNSGVYLRGMYEAQVVDHASPMQGIQGPGAIFGRIKPSLNAGRSGGKWNRYLLTLVDRHLTVILNGTKVIDNQPIEGCTGGGLQANDMLPGPILLQGDHTAVKYRNIRLRPIEVRRAN